LLYNIEDGKCAWGYMTVCEECRQRLLTGKALTERHLRPECEVRGLPLAADCELCGGDGLTGGERAFLTLGTTSTPDRRSVKD